MHFAGRPTSLQGRGGAENTRSDQVGGCAYCGATDKPLQRDCVLALSRGGCYSLDNIAPVCGSCNASKCNDEVTGWMRRKRLDERAERRPNAKRAPIAR